jgi:hypothetical protein
VEVLDAGGSTAPARRLWKKKKKKKSATVAAGLSRTSWTNLDRDVDSFALGLRIELLAQGGIEFYRLLELLARRV